jgi:hypothetical protein
VEIIQEIGSYAGFAAVVGLAILSALYFSQARDVRRLREWAGRAPERAAELEEGGRPAVAAMPVAARPQPQVRREEGATEAKPAAAGAAAGGAAAGAAGAAATASPAAAGAGATASPATAAAGAAPATAGASPAAAGAAPATASPGAGANGSEADEDESAEAERPAGAPAAATAAGAAGAGAATGDTGTGAKVLPARRPTPPVRPRPTIPPTRTIPARPGQPSVLGQAPGSRPNGRRGGRNWPAPRYIALIVAGVVILGLGGTVGILQLTKEDEQPQSNPPVTDLEDPTRTPDPPDETPAVNPATIKVAVLNATSTTGLAARIGSRLDAEGFQTGNLTNASERARAESVVMYKDGKESEARAVARRLDIGSREPIDAASSALAGDADVVVVLGADKAQQ